jgi:hypothetical protein
MLWCHWNALWCHSQRQLRCGRTMLLEVSVAYGSWERKIIQVRAETNPGNPQVWLPQRQFELWNENLEAFLSERRKGASGDRTRVWTRMLPKSLDKSYFIVFPPIHPSPIFWLSSLERLGTIVFHIQSYVKFPLLNGSSYPWLDNICYKHKDLLGGIGGIERYGCASQILSLGQNTWED